MTLIEAIGKCTVVDQNTIALPQEMLPNYKDVRQAFLKAGGKYKKNTFLFPGNAQSIYDLLTQGEEPDPVKQFQMFFTPSVIADKLVKLSGMPEDGIIDVLEPSAGQGAIIDAIRRRNPYSGITAFELNDINRQFLVKKYKESIDLKTEPDFLNFPGGVLFHFIIANPPFTKNQDVDHFMKMWELLQPGGTVVCITSPHWTFATFYENVGTLATRWNCCLYYFSALDIC
ncbi:MAG: class I SAM-dependent methyltransferase, partial [Ignavibacteriae bacterium]|nr:class I SAM-dependent methyltransferase [Ignavibacteriota bacterium]